MHYENVISPSKIFSLNETIAFKSESKRVLYCSITQYLSQTYRLHAFFKNTLKNKGMKTKKKRGEEEDLHSTQRNTAMRFPELRG